MTNGFNATDLSALRKAAYERGVEDAAKVAEAIPCGGFNGVPAALSENIVTAIRNLKGQPL